MKNLNAILYSGGQNASNASLHGAMSDLVGEQKRKSITYIPYCFDRSDIYFNRFKKRYSRFGFTDFHMVHADRKIVKTDIEKMLNSDVVYIAGGNTFYILHHLKASGIFSMLQVYAKTGGILAGLSAGAIILTPDIDLAGYPDFDRDENEVGIEDHKSLNLVEFEFFPHFNHRNYRLIGALKKHASIKQRSIIASTDGCGVVIDNGLGHFIGRNNFEITAHS